MVRDLGFAFRISLREMRGGIRGLWMFLTCLALGVGALTAVWTLSESVQEGLRRDARVLLGGDLEVRQTHRPLPPSVLNWLENWGRVARGVTLRTLARAGKERASLVELKAVDGSYPLYGQLELSSGKDPKQALIKENGLYGAVADRGLMARLSIGLGDRIRIGQSVFRITGEIRREPDKAGRFFRLGPRLMVPLKSLPETGLIRPGSVVSYFYKVRLLGTKGFEVVKRELRARYPDAGWRVRDFHSANRGLKRFLGNMTRYLTLVGLSALLLGGVGVAGAVRGYLEGRMNSIAAMKCLGAGRRLVLLTYLVQTGALALLGSGVGIATGLIFAFAVSSLISEMLGLGLSIRPDALTLSIAAGYGFLIALAFSIAPLSAANAVSPTRLFRGYSDPRPPRPSRLAELAIFLVGLVLVSLTWRMTDDLRLTMGFAAALAGSVFIFALTAWLMRRIAAKAPRSGGPWIRHAIVNVHRPGALTGKMFFSLGLGLTALVAVALVEGNFQERIQAELPDVAPSFFFLDIQPSQVKEFRRVVTSITGVSRMDSAPIIRGRIVRINGIPADRVPIDPEVGWVLRRDRGLTFQARKPETTTITEGAWWPENYRGKPLISFDERVARGFGVGIGDTLTLSILGRPITATIASLREINWASLEMNYVLVLSPNTLEGAPFTYLATAYADDEVESALFQVVTRRFPSIVPVYIKDILRDVSDVLGYIGLAVRTMALIALVTGLIVLVEAVRANLKTRHYESVLFKVFGATRKDVLLSLMAEFFLQGLATAILAAVLGSAISYYFVEWTFRGEWVFLPGPVILICLGGMAVTILLGLTGIRSVLGRKAWPVLRNE